MMSGKLFVDGYDVYSQFGVYVADNGWTSAVSYPALKTFEQNDWQEEDGVEADLSAPVLNTREVSLTFAVSGLFGGYEDFIALLSDGAYHVFNCEVIKRTYKLRLVSQSNRKYVITFGCETLRFADDFPLLNYEYIAPLSNVVMCDDYLIDGIMTTDYGMRVLQGSFAEVIKNPAVKQNMLRNIETKTGVIYDSQEVSYKAKDVKLICLMRADSLEELWRNYDALLYNLIKPDERLLYVTGLEQEFPFCYKSCVVNEFYPINRIWLKFTLTVTFVRDFRIMMEYLLAAETSDLIVTEDGVNFIDLRRVDYGNK